MREFIGLPEEPQDFISCMYCLLSHVVTRQTAALRLDTVDELVRYANSTSHILKAHNSTLSSFTSHPTFHIQFCQKSNR